MAAGGAQRVFLLLYEDTDGAKSINGAHASMELAEAWAGKLVKDLIVDTLLAGVDEDVIKSIEKLLEAGEFEAARQAYNALDSDQVWIEDFEVSVQMPAPDATLSQIV
jgi:hypothetical protein